MGERLALMVRPGRWKGPRPAGAIFLIAELADGLTRRDLDAALAAQSLEVTDFPADPEAVVDPAPPEPEPAPDAEPIEEAEEAAAVEPANVAAAPEPVEEADAPEADLVAEPVDEADAPEADLVEEPAEEPAEPEVTGAAEGDPEAAAIAETMKQGDQLAELLALTKPELIKRAEKEKATFSSRATKEQIAQEIIEVRAARKAD